MFIHAKAAAVAVLGIAIGPLMCAQETEIPSALNHARTLAVQAQSGAGGSDSTPAQSSAQQLVERLEASQEFQESAPVGYKYVRDDGLPYWILVPQFAELESRGYDGAHYVAAGLGPRVTVILGGPMAAVGDTIEIQVARAQQRYLGCSPGGITEINDVKASLNPISSFCGRRYDLLGQTGMYVYGGNIYPVVCGYTMTVADHTPNTIRTPIKAVERKYDNQRLGIETCDRVLHSIVFPKESGWVQPSRELKKTVIPGSLLRQSTDAAELPADDLVAAARSARKSRGSQPARVFDGSNLAGPDYVEFRMPYCLRESYRCYVATFQVPSKATQKRENGLQTFSVPIGKVPGTLDVQFGKSDNQPEWMSDEEFAKTLPLNGWSTYRVYNSANEPKVTDLGSETTHVGNFVAVINRTRSDSDFGSTTEVRAFIGTPGYVLNVHCEGRTEDFEKLDGVCSKFINSLRVHE